jgi:hypothetical protein
MKIAWGSVVGPKFLECVQVMCEDFSWTWDDAVSDANSCMAFESARTFSPGIVNAAGSGAVGLIQFMPATAQDLGTSTTALRAMTAVQQLEFVEKYFAPYASRVRGLGDMYMAILLPKYVGAPDDAVLFTEGKIAYRQNSGLDANTDGRITKAEAYARVLKMKNLGLTAPYVLDI